MFVVVVVVVGGGGDGGGGQIQARHDVGLIIFWRVFGLTGKSRKPH